MAVLEDLFPPQILVFTIRRATRLFQDEYVSELQGFLSAFRSTNQMYYMALTVDALFCKAGRQRSVLTPALLRDDNNGLVACYRD